MGLWSESCVCVTVISVHVAVAAVLACALGVRYGIYGDIQYKDMLTDTRILRLRGASSFCNSLAVETETVSDVGTLFMGVGLIASFLPLLNDVLGLDFVHKQHFDVYTLDSAPHIDQHERRYEVLRGTKHLSPRHFEHHIFHLLKGTSVHIDMCSRPFQANAESFVWLFVIQGQTRFNSWSNSHSQYRPSTLCPENICLHQQPIAYVSGCDMRGPFKSNFSMDVAKTDDYFFVFYHFHEGDCVESGDIQFFAVSYGLNRTFYSLEKGQIPYCRYRTNCTLPTGTDILITFPHQYRLSEYQELNVNFVNFKCEPNMVLYLGVFLLLPLVSAFIVSIACCIYRENKKDDALKMLLDAKNVTVNTYGTSDVPQAV